MTPNVLFPSLPLLYRTSYRALKILFSLILSLLIFVIPVLIISTFSITSLSFALFSS